MNNEIYNIYPIQNKRIFDFYLKARSCFWIEKEIDFSKDYEQWNLLSSDEQFFLSNILAFFAQSDQIVNTNLEERFIKDVNSLPKDMIIYTKLFYNFQVMMEDIHTQTYETMLDTYIKDKKQKQYFQNAITNIPCIKKKADWAFKWINDTKSSFATRLLAFAALEGIFFSGSFCAIFWMKDKNLLEGLTKSNEFIARDEGLHRDFACELFNQLRTRKDYDFDCNSSIIINVITEAVQIEKEFITKSFNCNLIGMNPVLMKQYIEYIADNLLQMIDEPKYYNSTNPFTFIENIGLENKANFFESRSTNYSKSGSYEQNEKIKLDLDF